MLDLLDLLLLLYIAFLFGINNSGIALAGMLASGFSYRASMGISVLGFMTGALLEGWKMGSVIMPEDHTVTFGVTAVILSIFSFLHMPVSMVNVLLAGYIGAGIDTAGAISVVAWWIVTPFMALGATVSLYSIMVRFTARLSLVSLFRFYSVLIPSAVFYASYTIGANNLGLLYTITMSHGYFNAADGSYMIIAAMLGTFIIGVARGKSISRLLSEGIVGHTPATILSSVTSCSIILWISTQIQIPLPFSQMLMGSLIGINMMKRPRIYSKHSLLLLVSSWTGSTLLSFLIVYVITRVM